MRVLNVLSIARVVGALIFLACIIVMVSNFFELTSLPINPWILFTGFGLMVGSRLLGERIVRRGFAKHG